MVLASLASTESGKVIWTTRVNGNLNSTQYIDLTDSLCNEIRNYLEISKLKQEAAYDLREVYTGSAPAYKFYLQGTDAEYDNDKVSAAGYFRKAIELDPGFITAHIALVRTVFNLGKEDEAKEYLMEAFKHYDECPLIMQLRLDEYKATLEKDMQEVIRLKKQILELDPDNRREWHALELEPDNPDFKHMLAYTLINFDINIDEGLHWIDQALEEFPDEPFALDIKAWGLFKKGKYKESLELLKKAWDNLLYYDHDIFLHLKEVEAALKSEE